MVGHTKSATTYIYLDNHGLIFGNESFHEIGSANLHAFDLIDFNPLAPTMDPDGTFVVVTDSTLFYYQWQERMIEYHAIHSYCDLNMDKVYSSPGNSVWYINL
jgi:hypothetical protein